MRAPLAFFTADAKRERAAIIRLIEAHAKDAEERYGATMLAGNLRAIVSEIEDGMQHDVAHVEGLEKP